MICCCHFLSFEYDIVLLIGISLLGLLWASQICSLVFNINLWKFSVSIVSSISSVLFLFLLMIFSYMRYPFVIFLHLVYSTIFFFFFVFQYWKFLLIYSQVWQFIPQLHPMFSLTLFSWTPKSLQMVTAPMKWKDACCLEEKLWST